MLRLVIRKLRIAVLTCGIITTMYMIAMVAEDSLFNTTLMNIEFTSSNVLEENALITKPTSTKQPPTDPETKVYRWKDDKWLRIPGFCSKPQRFLSAKLRSPVGTMKMYIHDVAKDIHVSGSIKRTGLWDLEGIYTMIYFLKADPEMGVVDVGSQLGTFSLVAAMMGRHVVAVDPVVENVIRLCKSVQDSNLTSKVTILFSAISSEKKFVTFRRLPNNIGGTHIANVISPQDVVIDMEDNYNKNYVHSVLLDDIKQFIDFPKVFMKIDVEGHEYEAMKERGDFFRSTNVRAILIEWFQIRATKSGHLLKNFLFGLNYTVKDLKLKDISKQDKPYLWPNDVLWLKKRVR